MSRVIVIGIDSLDSALISRWRSDLPTFNKLLTSDGAVKFTSVFPPDSITAWPSIYTGLNPSQHGILFFIDRNDSSADVTCEHWDEIAQPIIRGRTFWDAASSRGKRVCVIFPLSAYPAWPVNGVMISRTAKSNNTHFPLSLFPQDVFGEMTDRNSTALNTLQGTWARNQLSKYVAEAKRKLVQESDFAMSMLEREKWDLFFVYSGILDGIQHYLWKYQDESDAFYPGENNQFRDVIKEFYCLFDSMVGKFIEAADADTTLLILSDHGHTTRPVRFVDLNRFLEQKGLLIPRGALAKSINPYRLAAKLKEAAKDFIIKYHLEKAALSVMQSFPIWRKMYSSAGLSPIDWGKSIAYLSDLSGVNVYPYGGIRINKHNLNDLDYEEIRANLISEIAGMVDGPENRRIVKWICRREQMYGGAYIEKYPDILFELHREYGISMNAYDTNNKPINTHEIISGCHRQEGAVLLYSSSSPILKQYREMGLTDVNPLISELLGIKEGAYPGK